MNYKQKAWSANKVFQAKYKAMFRLLMCMVGLFVVTNVAMAIDGTISTDEAIGNVVTAMTVPAIVKGNPKNEDKSGKIIKSYIYVLGHEDYDDSQSFPASIGREVGNIPLINGAYWRKIEVILDTPEAKWTGSVGDIAAVIENSISFTLGGMDDSVFDWLESRLSLGAYVVFELCLSEGSKRFLIGGSCKPAILTEFDGGSTKDNTSTTVTFKQICGEILQKYIGNTPIIDPQPIAADATEIALVTGNDTYIIAEGTLSTAITGFSGITDADVDRTITVRGGGGAGASVLTHGTGFTMIGGEDWTANANTQISFRIFKDGADSYKAIEIAGSRT